MTPNAPFVVLRERIERNADELALLGEAIVTGEQNSAYAAAAKLLANVITGVPLLGALAGTLVQRALAGTATQRLLAEYRAYAQEKERARFIAELAAAVETLIAQATLESMQARGGAPRVVMEALGGLREDLADFRAEFSAAINTAAAVVHVSLQEVVAGAVGVQVSPESRSRAFIAHQKVSGRGSVGILLS